MIIGYKAQRTETYLQFKVATQFGKTVLSPATQVRNVTSASMFPLANGHIGGRASVTESIKMVMDDIFGAGKVIDETEIYRQFRKQNSSWCNR